MNVEDYVKAGQRCPSCGSAKLRAGYHEWQIMNSFICEDCGLRWTEDVAPNNYERGVMQLLEESPTEQKRRLLWVLHVATDLEKPLKNPRSSDETSYENFIKGK